MPKIITALENDGEVKMVEIKYTRTVEDVDGNDVSVLDYTSNYVLTDALANAEANKASIEAKLAEVNQEIADLTAIKDAE